MRQSPVIALFAAIVAALLVGAGCSIGDDDASAEMTANALRVTRDDGSRVEFADRLRAWCGTLGEPHGERDRRRALHVVGGEMASEGDEDPTAYWIVSRTVDALESSDTMKLPTENDESDPTFFVLDPETGTGNELSGYEEASRGVVVFEKWGCEERDVVRIRVDATLDSELHDLPNAKVDGEVVAVIGDKPALPD